MANLSAKLKQKQKPLISIQSWTGRTPVPKSSKTVTNRLTGTGNTATNRLPGNITVRVKTELYPVSDSGVSGTSLPSTVSSAIKNWKDRATAMTSSATTTTTIPNKNSPMKGQKHKPLFDSPKSGQSYYGKMGYASPNRVQGTVTTRIKTELCPVTEICTAATLPTPSPKSLSKSLKEKSENRFQFLPNTFYDIPKKAISLLSIFS